MAQMVRSLPAVQETQVRSLCLEDPGRSCVVNFPWRRQWQATPVFLPGESHGRKSLVGCSPRGRKESDTTERLHFHLVLGQGFTQVDSELFFLFQINNKKKKKKKGSEGEKKIMVDFVSCASPL